MLMCYIYFLTCPYDLSYKLKTSSPILEAPSAPRGPIRVSSVTSNSCDVRWQPPEEDGGCAITSYVLELRETTRSMWRRLAVVDATTTSYRISQLDENEEYFVRVSARNREGDSFPAISEVISPRPSASTPSAPSSLQIDRISRDSVSLSWLPPIYNGGSEIMRYVILKQQRPHDLWEDAG